MWQLTHLGATAACQRRLEARRCTEQWRVYGQSLHGTVLMIEPAASLRTLLREVLELEGYETWLKPCIARQDSRLLTWRSRRASRWTSGISSSGDMDPA